MPSRLKLRLGFKRRAARRGGVYVAVIGVAMIVSMIGLATLHFERVRLRVTAGRDALALAQMAANSGVELAFARIKADANWRTTYVNNQDVPSSGWTSLGSAAKFNYSLVDSDGSLSDNDNDSVKIRAVGVSGDATCVATVLAEPGRPGLTCLDVPLHAGGRVRVDSSSTLSTNSLVSSNDFIQVQVILDILGIRIGGSWIDGDAWSTGSITNNGVSGTSYENRSPAREMPDASAAFDYYLSAGTWIDIASIPSRIINRALISPKSNPYGPVNPQGIYVIDCKGQSLTIRDSRIHATIVLLNASATPELDNTLHWEPAAANYPALMVQGPLLMNWDGGVQLSEVVQTTNFNPVGTPYLSNTDSDILDLYPGVIKGMVYVTGNLTINDTCVMEGAMVVGGTVTSNANASLTYSPTARDYPPPGFGAGSQMRLVPSTWRRTVR
jgi:hypothetical protein